ncbi:hypothetical protein DICPUDRAFT_78724 [Dictyostelium purpureum]|uniref:Uncharacterized protein n=1 Tax=Dictyostelium purpureum TaxID=5786 RepID=F0ZKD2_DICPU|nr:uncharacterized protein DICPUDRAFT_78724 [Dictyostelium purpureum]EGC35590.1 hypothetical protein DICPUDRAFT_78724 [Dictyostelium purpureum]|eukprot:XP_003287893.1 hypothetical protein DICPUDRAFT_78724 [Dictyostelium purpureum]
MEQQDPLSNNTNNNNDIENNTTTTTTTTNINNNNNNSIEINMPTNEENDNNTITQSTEEPEDGSSYEYISGQRVCIIIDSDESTNRALNKAMDSFDKTKDELYLLTVTSSLDFLNDEKNDAKLSLYKYEHYFDSIGIDYIPISVEAYNISSKIVSEIEENEIDIVYVGAQALSHVSNPDNIIFSVFSYIKQTVLGSIVSNLKSSSEKIGCSWKLEIVN